MSTWVQGPKHVDHLQMLSQAHELGAGSAVEQVGLKLVLTLDASIMGGDLTRWPPAPTSGGCCFVLSLLCCMSLACFRWGALPVTLLRGPCQFPLQPLTRALGRLCTVRC